MAGSRRRSGQTSESKPGGCAALDLGTRRSSPGHQGPELAVKPRHGIRRAQEELEELLTYLGFGSLSRMSAVRFEFIARPGEPVDARREPVGPGIDGPGQPGRHGAEVQV